MGKVRVTAKRKTLERLKEVSVFWQTSSFRIYRANGMYIFLIMISNDNDNTQLVVLKCVISFFSKTDLKHYAASI